jgi:hypothetical protein
MTGSHDAEHFRQLYARSADPRAFQTSGYEQEKYRRLRIPAEWPEGRFDLIVLSEVLYFLTAHDIAAVAARVLTTLDTDGVVVSVNWRGHGDDPCGGDEAATVFEPHPSRAECRIPLSYRVLPDRPADPTVAFPSRRRGGRLQAMRAAVQPAFLDHLGLLVIELGEFAPRPAFHS